MSNIEYKNLIWDSQYFNMPCAKIILKGSIEAGEIKNIKAYCDNYKFITIVNENNIDENNKLITLLNAYLADVNVEFVKSGLKGIKHNNIKIDSSLNHDNDIRELALKSFKHSRFANVEFIEQEKGRNIYAEWVKNSFNKADKYFCRYIDNEKILGFLLFHFEDDILVIELIAVDENSKGKGVGKALISSVEEFGKQNNALLIRVGTQLNNIIAQNFYVSCGFRHNKNSIIYIKESK